jgi:hypothetical protein
MLLFVRFLPVLLIAGSAMLYIAWVERSTGYLWRNLLPVAIVVVLAAVTLWRGGASWTSGGWRWLLATLGFALPAVGLSVYLHYGYTIDLHGMFSESVYPNDVFRFLPLYTVLAGGIGFAIGWIVGRNI